MKLAETEIEIVADSYACAPAAPVVHDCVVDEVEAVALVVQGCHNAVKCLHTHTKGVILSAHAQDPC